MGNWRARVSLLFSVGILFISTNLISYPASAASTLSTPVISSNDSSFILSWKQNEKFTSQTITVLGIPENDGTPKACFTATVNPSSTSYPTSRAKLSTCGNEISFKISGKNVKGVSSEVVSKPVSAFPPAKVTNVAVVSTGQNSVTVTWSPLPGRAPASTYTVRLSTGAEKQVSADSPSATFSGLKIGEKISASVRANVKGILTALKEIPGKKVIEVGAKAPTLVISNVRTIICPEGSFAGGEDCVTKETTKPAQSLYSYTCPNGGSVSGSTCVTGGSTPATGTPSLSCSSGTLDGANCVTPATSIPATATTVYLCPSGSTLVGTSCSTTTIPASPTYTCPTGMTLSGAYCTSITTYAASGNSFFGYSCPSGGLLSHGLSGWVCTSTNYYNATTTYSCPTGGTVSGPICATNTVSPATATISDTCPNGGSLSGSICYTTTSIAPSTVYSCSQGMTLSGNSCTSTYTYAASVSVFGVVSCPSGGTSYGNSLSGYTCTVTNYFSATVSYTCSTGYVLTGSSCTATTMTPSTPITIYSCPSGSTLSGTNCLNNTSPATPTTVYSCPSGDTLSGGSCLISAVTTPTITGTTYTCPSGAVLSGTNCVTPTTSVPATANITYACTTGVLVGSQCVIASVSVDPANVIQTSTLTTTNATDVNVNNVPYHSAFDTTVCAVPYAIQVSGAGGQIYQLLYCLRTA